MPRKPVTVADLRPFLARTGQLHLIGEGENGAGSPSSRPVQPISALPGDNTAVSAPEVTTKGKKRLQMNGTEAEFSLILESWRQAGKIMLWEYEAITLRWGVLDVLKYTPDFVIFDSIEVDEATPAVPRIQMRFIEIKGAHIRNRQAGFRTFKEARNRWHGIFVFELWQKQKENGWTQIF